jgi:myxalamid-type polyketide synthase MxaB
MPRAARRDRLLKHLRAQIARLLHYERLEDVEPNARFADLGIDSLVAVEFRNVLEAACGTSLAASLIFDYPSLPLLLDYLSDRIWGVATVEGPGLRRLTQAMTPEGVDREHQAV